MSTQLYNLPTGAPMRIQLADGSNADATYLHMDGGNAECALAAQPSDLFFLRGYTPMILVNDRWEIFDGD